MSLLFDTPYGIKDTYRILYLNNSLYLYDIKIQA
jgi:hypothetical protein